MGKKSRKKRERRIAKGSSDPGFLLRELRAFEQRAAHKADINKTFKEQLEATRNVFRRYRPIDAAIALNVSDLWPANVGSMVKHIYAWGVLLGLGPSDSDAMRISSYSEFCEFATSLFSAWPEFPMLEDFSPEADWGQIRVRLGSQFVPMFYGGCIERTPDFVEAFRITYASHPSAQAHMDLAIAVQMRLIEEIPDLGAAPVPEVRRGHVEIPPESFWEACRSALLKVGCESADWRRNAGTELETSFGSFKAPSSWGAFGDAVVQGTALPYLAVVEGSEWIPVSMRSAAGVVIDHWANLHSEGVSHKTHRMLAHFIAERFIDTAPGPLTPMVGTVAYAELPISCVISTRSGFYLVCACDHASNARVSRATKRLYSELRRGAPLHLFSDDGHVLMLSKNGEGDPGADDIHVLIIVTQSGTALGSIDVPERPARLLPLADFITIFDSLEDVEDLDRFWRYVDAQREQLGPFSTGPADLFASFKDAHGVLVDGATSPTLIMLDPRWGTSWRFQKLMTFWSRAPRVFPDGSSGWELEDGTKGVVHLKSRHDMSLAYSTVVGNCTAQAQINIVSSAGIEDARMADMFAQVLIDSLNRCRELIADAPLFQLSHVVFRCQPDHVGVIERDAPPLLLKQFDRVVVSVSQVGAQEAIFCLKLDARAVLAGLNEATDGAFEIRCLVETLEACHDICELDLPSGLGDRLQTMALEPARYQLKVVDRYVDVPDYVDPLIPSPTEYKLARKHLAVAIKDLGLLPGRYELSEAKTRIDLASERLRLYIESRLMSLDRAQMLGACIEQHDALLVAERLKVQMASQSLSHAVEYDRLEAVEDARKKFGSAARHYRYLLEKVVSSPATGAKPVDEGVLRELVGLVDWYMVLTEASDVLHNGVDVGGVEIDDSFIPEVFYSTASDQRGSQFAREYAKSRLGIDIEEQDVVEGASADLLSSQEMRDAFIADVGFELQHLINSLAILSQARRHGLGEEFALSYTAERNRIVQVLADNIEGLQIDEAEKIVDFLTLSKTGIRRLSGKEVDEIDVPHWEHNKRIHRYAIRPLIENDSALRWGAEQSSRAMNIWMSSVRDGYLPADFDWPTVVPVIREVKKGIEKQLELRTEQIFLRHTPYVARGMDFFRKFRGEGFENVGDFDVLAYWPEANILVAVECKYNQPPYTTKDGRRLRDKIFGNSETDRSGQLSRIAGRRAFLRKNRQRMLELLKWPASVEGRQRDVELYVSRDMYFWMVHPPYPVPTEFVRVDALDAWIKKELARLTQA